MMQQLQKHKEKKETQSLTDILKLSEVDHRFKCKSKTKDSRISIKSLTSWPLFGVGRDFLGPKKH